MWIVHSIGGDPEEARHTTALIPLPPAPATTLPCRQRWSQPFCPHTALSDVHHHRDSDQDTLHLHIQLSSHCHRPRVRDGCCGPPTRVLTPMAGPASPPSFPACPSLGCGSSAGFSLALSASVGLNRQAADPSPKSLSSCSDAVPVASQALGPEDGKAGCPTVHSQGACHLGALEESARLKVEPPFQVWHRTGPG